MGKIITTSNKRIPLTSIVNAHADQKHKMIGMEERPYQRFDHARPT